MKRAMKLCVGFFVSLAAFATMVPVRASDALHDAFVNPPAGYGEVPFWWWSGDRLDRKRLLAQLEDLHQAGVSGAQINYCHLRSGNWRTSDGDPAVFTDEWWDFFNFVAEESAKRGMGIGLSGYTLDWPGNDNLWKRLGICAPETRARPMRIRTEKSSGCQVGPFTDADLVSVAAFPRKGGEPTLLDAKGGTLSEGEWEVRIVTAPPANRTLDPLNPESAKRLIARFLDPFEKRVSEKGRKALNYFFQDELRLGGNRNLWCDDFADEFKRRKGYDVRPYLSGLFMDAGPMTDKVRLDANDVQVQLSGERYFEPIYNWHASRGLIYACDPMSRGLNPIEFGDYMRTMRWYTAPGFDTPNASANVNKNKVGSSIAHLYERPRVWLEGYHSLGWQADPRTIFSSTVHNFVYGSSLLNLHGLYYSTYGGWWEWAPPCYHFRMPYWPHMKAYLKYFERLSYILSQGVHVADVAVLYPIEPLVIDGKKGFGAVNAAHAIVSDLVTKHSVDVDYIDCDSILRATVKDGALCVAGERYRVVVLPDMSAIRLASLRKIHEFRKAGGSVVVLGQAPGITDAKPEQREEVASLLRAIDPVFLPIKPAKADCMRLVQLAGKRDFEGPDGAKVLHRRIGACDAYYLVDLPGGESVCTFRAKGRAELWDPWTGTRTPLASRVNASGLSEVALMGDAQPKLVVFSPGESLAAPERKVVAETTTVALDGDWRFTLEPTCDNAWGDYRLPATKEKIGAEIRRFTVDLPNGTEVQTVEFGPQFRFVGTDSYHSFSWRWGEEARPGFQDSHHGLNKVVGDEFLTFGPYDNNLYNVNAPRGARPERVDLETSIVVPESCSFRFETSGCGPREIVFDGRPCSTNDVMTKAKGIYSLRVSYECLGRGAIVARRTDVPARPSTLPLSMKWRDDPSVLKFDPYGGKLSRMTCRATVPPGFRSAVCELETGSKILSATCAGHPLAVSPGSRGVWTLASDETLVAGGELVLVLEPAAGCAGGAVFRGPVKLSCGEGRIALGDWARFDGLACYSGGAVYEKEFTLTDEQAKGAVRLNLGSVGATCDVRVNGGEAAIRCTPPWTVDLTGKVRVGRNVLRVRVFNTLNNHYQTIPTRYKKPTQKVPSGLLGPVTLVCERNEE